MLKKRTFLRNLLVLTLAILVPSIAVASISLGYGERALRAQEIAAAQSDLALMNQCIDATLQICCSVAFQIEKDTALLKWLYGLDEMAGTYAYSSVYPMFHTWSDHTEVLLSGDSASSAYLYLDGMQTVLSTDGIRRLSSMRDVSWLDVYTQQRERFVFLNFLTCGRRDPLGGDIVSFFNPIVDSAGRCFGVFVVNLSQRFMTLTCGQSEYESASVYLLDAEGRQFYANDGSSIDGLLSGADISTLSHGGTGNFTAMDGRKYIVTTRRSTQFDWLYCQVVEEGELFAGLLALRRVLVVLLGSAVLIAVVFALFYTAQNYRPIATMVEIIDTYNDSGTFKRPKNARADVYGHIIFNLMNALVEKNEMRVCLARAELSEKDAQLRAMQSRINPHFLYNALELANWEAIRSLGRGNQVSFILKNMADSFRSVLSDKRLVVPLREEIEALTPYIRFLQCVEYRPLDVACLIDANAQEVPVPRLLIQPLVENSYIHGLRQVERPRIHIVARRRASTLALLVADNGVGLSRERLAEIKTALAGETNPDAAGFAGLSNVNNRLLSRYGEAYGLHIRSREGKGTAVYIRIPLAGIPAMRPAAARKPAG